MQYSFSQLLRVGTLAGLLLASQVTAATYPRPGRKILPRQSTPSACPPLGPIVASNGGRKIAIVIDSSGSNTRTDPSNIRISAGKALNEALVASSEATDGKTADLVTVIDFDGSAAVLYPLGDPAGAVSSFDSIDSSGSTSIASGVRTAIDELTKADQGSTSNRTGIVVLTDGQSSINPTIEQLERAKTEGIRVSFGFLSGDSSSATSDDDLLAAILGTGGIYSTISSAEAQQNFIGLVLSNGLTGDETSSAGTVLLPGLSVAAFLSDSNTFLYTAQPGEKLNFTVSSATIPALSAVLKAAGSDAELGNAATDAPGAPASILFEAADAVELVLSVSAANAPANSVFTVALGSSIPINTNCTLTPPVNTTTPYPAHPSGGSSVPYPIDTKAPYPVGTEAPYPHSSDAASPYPGGTEPPYPHSSDGANPYYPPLQYEGGAVAKGVRLGSVVAVGVLSVLFVF